MVLELGVEILSRVSVHHHFLGLHCNVADNAFVLSVIQCIHCKEKEDSNNNHGCADYQDDIILSVLLK